MNHDDIINIIKEDELMMDIINFVYSLHLPDCYVAGGFVRNKIWDYLHSKENRTPYNDIDVVYYSIHDVDKNADLFIEGLLSEFMPNMCWSVKNQARMHIRNNHQPYLSTLDAISKWTETATCIGVNLSTNNKIILIAPHGIEDLVNLVVRPTKDTDIHYYHNRINSKNWRNIWPKLRFLDHE